MKITSESKLSIYVVMTILLMAASFVVSAQTPQWDWAKGVGSNGQDGVSGLNLDSVGNVYEVISCPGNSIRLGTQTFTNPHPQSASIFIFVKYNTQGNVVWAKEFPENQFGQFISPTLTYTDKYGYSYLYFSIFRDSLSLGGITLRDTSATSGFCIAKYDPNGNVLWIHLKKSLGAIQPYTGIVSIMPWDDSHMLLLASENNGGLNPLQLDTIDGIALPAGSSFVIMDTSTNFLSVRYLGCDTLTRGYIQNGVTYYYVGHGPISSMASGNITINAKKSLYFNFDLGARTVFDTSIHISDTARAVLNGQDLLLKLDSSFDFQWYLSGNSGINSGLFASDPFDNVYVSGLGGTMIGETVSIGNLVQTFPINLISPNGYFCLIKIDPYGNPLWIDTFLNRTGNAGNIQGVFTDLLGNAYMGGRYDSYLNAGPYTLPDQGNLFVVKVRPNGQVAWAQGTHNASGKMGPYNFFAADEQGDVYISGLYFYTGQPGFGLGDPIFGQDTLIGFTPASGYPIAPDVFTARLGSCSPSIPQITASGPLVWCGRDSVVLSAPQVHGYLWSTGDTTQTILADSSGRYSVYAIDSLGCYAQSAASSVAAHPQPSFTATVTKEVSCFNDSTGKISLSASAGIAPYAYSSVPPVSNFQSVSAGTYYISLIDSNGCVARDTISVTQPASALHVQIDTINDGAIILPSGSTPPYTYIWNNSVMKDTISQVHTGWYTVTVTDSNGCQAADSVYITGPTGVGYVSSSIDFNIYPNPVTHNNQFTISTSQIGSIIFSDALGRVIGERKLSNGINSVKLATNNEVVFYKASLQDGLTVIGKLVFTQ